MSGQPRTKFDVKPCIVITGINCSGSISWVFWVQLPITLPFMSLSFMSLQRIGFIQGCMSMAAQGKGSLSYLPSSTFFQLPSSWKSRKWSTLGVISKDSNFLSRFLCLKLTVYAAHVPKTAVTNSRPDIPSAKGRHLGKLCLRNCKSQRWINLLWVTQELACYCFHLLSLSNLGKPQRQDFWNPEGWSVLYYKWD